MAQVDERIQQLKQQVKQAKDQWQTSRALDDAVRLQSAIEEKRKVEQLWNRKEKEKVLARSRECRKFYEQQFAEQRREFQQECDISMKQAKDSMQQHKKLKKEEQRLIEYELKTAYTESRIRLRDIAADRQLRWNHEFSSHNSTQNQFQQAKAAAQDEQRQQQKLELQRINETCTYHKNQRQQRIEEETEIASYVEREFRCVQHNSRESHAAKKAHEREKELQRRKEAASLRKSLRCQHEYTRAIERLEASELNSRLAIIREHNDISLTFGREHSEFVRLGEKKKCERRSTSAHENIDSESNYAVAQQRRKELKRAEDRRRAKSVQLIEKRRADAKKCRVSMLERVLQHAQEEGQKVNGFRLKTLERRRGEKMATECEPFVVQPNSTSAVDHLNDGTKSLVVSIIRESDF